MHRIAINRRDEAAVEKLLFSGVADDDCSGAAGAAESVKTRRITGPSLSAVSCIWCTSGTKANRARPPITPLCKCEGRTCNRGCDTRATCGAGCGSTCTTTTTGDSIRSRKGPVISLTCTALTNRACTTAYPCCATARTAILTTRSARTGGEIRTRPASTATDCG